MEVSENAGLGIRFIRLCLVRIFPLFVSLTAAMREVNTAKQNKVPSPEPGAEPAQRRLVTSCIVRQSPACLIHTQTHFYSTDELTNLAR